MHIYQLDNSSWYNPSYVPSEVATQLDWVYWLNSWGKKLHKQHGCEIMDNDIDEYCLGEMYTSAMFMPPDREAKKFLSEIQFFNCTFLGVLNLKLITIG